MTFGFSGRVKTAGFLLAFAFSAACSDSTQPKDSADGGPAQGTAGAAWGPDGGTVPERPDALPTMAELCAGGAGDGGGLPVKHPACENRECGEECDPCETPSGVEPGCSVDPGIYRCSIQRVCEQTAD